MAVVPALPLPTDRTFRRTLVRSAAPPFVLLLVLGAVMTWQVERLLAARRWIQHTHDVIFAIVEVRRAVFEEELRTRGALLGLAPPAPAPPVEATVAQAAALPGLVADNPAQVRRAQRLQRALADWAEYRRALAGAGDPRAVVRDLGEPSVGEVLAAADVMLDEEERLRGDRVEAAEARARRTLALGLGLSLGVGTLLAAVTARRVGHTVSTYSTALREIGARAASLAESEERFRLIVDAVQDYAIFTLDPKGRVASWNPGAERLTGWRTDEVLGRPLADVLAGAADVEHELAMAREHGRFELEAPRRRKDGSLVWAQVSVAPLRDARGVLLGYVKVTRDVTARVEAERALRRAADELEARVEERTAALRRANAELEAFGYSVSHDLRAPLRAMHGFAEALAEDADDRLRDDEREHLRQILRAADRMETLITDLLAYSRLAREDLPAGRVVTSGVVDEALEDLRPAIERTGAEVLVAQDLPDVLAHRTTLVQVLENLLANALKFVAPGARPQVRVWSTPAPEGRVRLWVEDHGIGIAPEHHERIFRVFERLHGEEEYTGTGIGLAIVRKGAERMGGRAGVESTPGQGSRFWVELPAAGGRA